MCLQAAGAAVPGGPELFSLPEGPEAGMSGYVVVGGGEGQDLGF